ncbi:MAG TPA: VOC family protein [Spongiibacteraceae bacterium]|nr:VOC family protein [Spongiibacteraceae bacterium]HUH36451.1 VOC family protein [Spongiibacteraceae bacterium]
MNTAHASPLAGLPPADQICLVVRDLAAAVAMYEPLFGPFTVLDNGPFESVYRGETVMVDLPCAFGRSGELEIELVQWRSGPTPHRDFIQSGREGVQHIRYVVDDLPAWIARAAELAYRPVWSGSYPASDAAPPLSWCYLERDDDPLMIEFVQWG